MSAGWETVYDPGPGAGELLERHRVHGGWLFRSTQWSERDHEDPGPVERTESMTFVPGNPQGKPELPPTDEMSALLEASRFLTFKNKSSLLLDLYNRIMRTHDCPRKT